jgi:lipid A ethanolaminephosphotransferase
MVWVSDDFKAKYPESIDSIKSYANTEISHDYVFHSILDCLNIDSDIIDKDLSICKSS